MKYAPVLFLAIILSGCDARNESRVIDHGMKWSIAQRELEQNAWVVTLPKSGMRTPRAGDGKAYRYQNAQGKTVDFVTEQVGDIEKVYRIFDADGREIEALEYK